MTDLTEMGKRAKAASKALMAASPKKDAALCAAAKELERSSGEILAAKPVKQKRPCCGKGSRDAPGAA